MILGFGEEKFNDDYINIIYNLNILIILVLVDIKFINLNGVFVDNVKGGFEVINLFIKEGYIKIVIIIGLLSLELVMDRLIGYKKVLEVNKILVEEEYILSGEFKLEKVYELIKNLLK